MSTITSRLLLSYVLVIAVGTLAAGAAIAGLLVRYQDDVTRVRLEELSAPLLAAVQRGVQQGRSARDVIASLTEQADAADVRLLILANNPQRRVLVDSEGGMEGQTLPPPAASGVGEFRRDRDEWIFVQRALGQAGLAVVARPKAVFADTLRALLPSLLVSALIAIGFALIVAALLARGITRPIRDLVAGVRRFATGRYRTRAAVSGPSELRELAGAFNDMADEIERARGSEHAFLADISHELRTPLTSIHGFAQAIVDREVEGERTVWAGQLIQREARRLIRMVEGLLQVARIEAGAQRMSREPIDLAALVNSAVDALAVQAREAQVTIERDLGAAPRVQGDRDRLTQLFINVVDNAVKHSPAGTAVHVVAAAEDGGAIVRVRDEGSGLPEGAQERLFERFWRGDTARDGTGLGLAIARAIAQAHGGRIDARNTGAGGAEFAVHLPLS